jgi:hypothetical protein
MWFLLGFMTLAICVVASYFARQAANWKPDEREGEFEYKLDMDKGKVSGLLFGVSGVREYSFTIKNETWYDRFFKRFKISNEIQTGDSEFDDLVYVLSDNSLLHEKLVSSEAIRIAIKNIFNFGVSKGYTVKKLECRNGRLWIKCSIQNNFSETNVRGLIARPLLPQFFAIAKELNQINAKDYNRWLDPFVFKSLVVLGISTGLAVNAVVQLFRTWLGDFPFIVDINVLVFHSILLGILIITGLIIFTLWWLKNSSRTHIVLLEIFTIGLLGAVGTAFHELRDINIEWQKGQPQIFVSELKDHYVVKKRRYGRRGGYSTTHYYLLLDDWNCKCNKTYEKEVSYDTYRQLNYYRYLGVVQYPGALGYSWVSDIKPSNYSQTR